jgi:hypothetical protein
MQETIILLALIDYLFVEQYPERANPSLSPLSDPFNLIIIGVGDSASDGRGEFGWTFVE